MSPRRDKFNPARTECTHGRTTGAYCEGCDLEREIERAFRLDPPSLVKSGEGWPRRHSTYEEFCRELDRNDRRMWLLMLVLLATILVLLGYWYVAFASSTSSL